MQNLTKERKQPPVVILQLSIFYNIFIWCLWLRIIRRSDQGVYFMNFPSHIFFNDINHSYRAAILKKVLFGCFHRIWLWLLIAIMKRCVERCVLQLYRTSSRTGTLNKKYQFFRQVGYYAPRLWGKAFECSQIRPFRFY